MALWVAMADCGMGHVQEKDLAAQVSSHIEKVSICEEWKNLMLEEVSKWEREESQSSRNIAHNLQQSLDEHQGKLDRLVSAYVDGDIPKESYLPKKEALLTQKIALTSDLKRAGREGGKIWIEPLKNWIEAANTASELVSSNNFEGMKSFIRRNGSNPVLANKKMVFSFSEPWSSVALHKAQTGFVALSRDQKNFAVSGEISKPTV